MEQYPDPNFYDSANILFEIFSITYNVKFNFLPYDLKLTETLTPEWNQESVIGRMDSIATFKRMTRTMNATFKARVRYGEKLKEGGAANVSGKQKDPQFNRQTPFLPVDDLLHAIDHIKKTLYPRYNSTQILTSPPLFRIKYGNLILAGEETALNGVLCYINSFSANPVMETNKVSYKVGGVAVGPVGNLGIAAYPNIFDINIGFTILNENLALQQQTGILNKRYFYDYSTNLGPEGGHEGDGHRRTPEEKAALEALFEKSNESTSETEQATNESITQGT